MASTGTKIDVLAKSRFLRFVNVQYTRPTDGKIGQWQYVERTTRTANGIDAVNVFGVLKRKGKDPHVLVVKQFRPPLGKQTVELPAGLVDPGETPEVAALRELKEETGYTGRLVGKSGVACLSPGLTNETMVTIYAEIDGDAPENQNPQQSDEDGKLGVTHEWLPVAGLVQQLSQLEQDGYGIFAGLYSIAHGLQLRETLGL